MAIDVNRLRRRPPGDRALVYLDQSTLSSLARGDEHGDLLEVLRRGVKSGAIICPTSVEHDAETMLAAESWEAIDNLADELSLGVSFEDPEMITWYELSAAACEFLGRAPELELWREAFRTDPHTPLDSLFPGGFRVRVASVPSEALNRETEHLKASESLVNEAYENARAAGRSFEEQAELEFEAMLSWRLGRLFEPKAFATRLERLTQEAALELLVPGAWEQPGSAIGRYMAIAVLDRRAESFAEHFPELAERADEFRQSEPLRSAPSVRYPTLLRAALAVMPGRQARPGDPYDIAHLTNGLSRCDFVTTDSGMAQLCRDRSLVPDSCTLYGPRELGELTDALS